MSKVPDTQLARAGVVGSTAVRLGVGKLKSKAKRPFMSQQAVNDDVEKQQSVEAEILFNAITQLRGTAVKLAQMLGMETDLLPERVREELTKSYYKVPQLNRVLVQKVLLDEFGKTPQALFANFNSEAMAAASLGQVHQAELKDGQHVAVKVQYPGVHVTIDSDIKLLRKLSRSAIPLLAKHARPSKNVIDISIDEVGARLREETDYRLEANNTQWFKENLSLSGIQVPRVYEQFCSDRVLTTEMLQGQHLDDWLATNPSQETRDKAAQLINDCFVVSTMQLGRLHADPNPGNYLFKENGDVALVDFGCVKVLSSRFTDNLPNLLFAFYQNDIEKIIDAYAAIGMRLSNTGIDDFHTVIRPFGKWLAKPFKEPYFDFKEHNRYTNEGLQLIREIAESASMEEVEEDFIFFDRTLYGLFKIFERLEARVCFRANWEAYWGTFTK